MALNATYPLHQSQFIFFLDRRGEAVPGTIYRDSMHPFPPSPQVEPEPLPSEPLSSSVTPPRSPLLHAEFLAVLNDHFLYQEATQVGSMDLSIRKSCFQGKTQKFLWIDNVTNRLPKEIQRVGTALIEAAIEESIAIGLKGRVKLMAIEGSHLFYLKCGFLPEEEGYTYPDCVRVTQFLKRAGLLKGKLRHAEHMNDPLMQRAIEILSIEHSKNQKEIDLAFIQKNWYWDDEYPTKPIAAYALFIGKVRAYTAHPPDRSTWSFTPIDMYLPDQSLEIWKRIIDTPKKYLQERDALMKELRSVVAKAIDVTI